jgi:hypothetical protein
MMGATTVQEQSSDIVLIDPRLAGNREMQERLATEQSRAHAERSVAAPDATRESSETGQSAWRNVQGAAKWVSEGTRSNAKWVVEGTQNNFGKVVAFGADTAARAVNAWEVRRAQSPVVQGSMGETKVPASLSRTQPAATNQQQASYSNRQTTAPVAGQGKFGDKFAKVAALSAIGTTMAVGFAAAAPLVLAAAPAVAMAYMAIKTVEALMKFFNKGGQQQGQPRATSGQQQQQPTRQQQGQAQTQAPAAQATAPAPVQGAQQAELQTPGNASGGTEFTQDVNLDTGFNLDAYLQSIQGMGSR